VWQEDLRRQAQRHGDGVTTTFSQSVLSWISEPGADRLPDQGRGPRSSIDKMAKTFAEPWQCVRAQIPVDFSFGLDHITTWNLSIGWDKSELDGRMTLACGVSDSAFLRLLICPLIRGYAECSRGATPSRTGFE